MQLFLDCNPFPQFIWFKRQSRIDCFLSLVSASESEDLGLLRPTIVVVWILSMKTIRTNGGKIVGEG